ncbi:hypothetical protein ES288_D07G269000v1 [Gossypium darwinii]|uniref:Uncharacterized protein n=2 Tax=Gossypium TaxID=3633 RepID=A0A5D2KC29_GOSTO|nr:hypothetical protein ES288_D07G269000v1 [Gossypium darwinii]TYH64424.1 hypothetical protein ES332_D07G266900v1 [Gossypium tomentosum]
MHCILPQCLSTQARKSSCRNYVKGMLKMRWAFTSLKIDRIHASSLIEIAAPVPILQHISNTQTQESL